MTEYDDLVDRLNAEIAASNLAGRAVVTQSDGVLRLSAVDPTGALRLDVTGSNPIAQAELGFLDASVAQSIVGSVGLEQLDLAGGLQLELVDAEGAVVSGAVVPDGQTEVELSLNGVPGGEYRLHVSGATGSEMARYDLTFDV